MQYSNFDTNLLRTLDALLAEKSVTRAADRMCISQPAMSGALLRLREHFKDQLLIRMGRDMVLSPLGESLVNPVRETLLQIELTLATRPYFDPATSERRFELAMTDYGAFMLMPPLLRRLSVEAPHMTCSLDPLRASTVGRLEAGDLDCLITVESCEILARGTAAQDLKMRTLHYDDFVCVVDAQHPSVDHELSLEDYRRLPHVIVKLGTNLETLVEQAWRRADLDLKVVATAPSFASMLFMVPGTPMVATVQRRLAQTIADSLQLRILECPVEVRSLQQVLIWHPRNDLDPGHQYLRKMLVEAAGVKARKQGGPVLSNLIQIPTPAGARVRTKSR
jgi:DNA-binding transcriptional LysR family regulator